MKKKESALFFSYLCAHILQIAFLLLCFAIFAVILDAAAPLFIILSYNSCIPVSANLNLFLSLGIALLSGSIMCASPAMPSALSIIHIPTQLPSAYVTRTSGDLHSF